VRARNTAPYTWESFRYFPWGEEQTTTAQNRDKFATYFRDSSGLDYALHRHYSSSHGRFLTPDPYVANDALRNPQSWNRYPYVENDPVNYADAQGLLRRCPAGTSSTGWTCVADDVIGVEYEPARLYDGPELLPGGGGGGSSRPEVDCSSEFPVAGMEERLKGAAPILRQAAGNDEVLLVLATFTWMEESGFRQDPPPNVNIVEGQTREQAISAGNVDIGPMQINYRSHINARGIDPVGVFGTFNPAIPGSLPASFNGSVQANVNYGTGYLKDLMRQYGSPAAAAGRYVVGGVAGVEESVEYQGRKGLFEVFGPRIGSYLRNCL
jgi:RHS repeat-associated protein